MKLEKIALALVIAALAAFAYARLSWGYDGIFWWFQNPDDWGWYWEQLFPPHGGGGGWRP